MKKLKVYFLLVLIFLILTACNKSIPQSVETEQYSGRNLSIGVIGQAPKVREEEKVEFIEIQFSDLEEEFLSQFDAIIISEDNLSEASQARYTSIYKESKIPYFFIQSDKSHVPFTQEDLSYEDVPNLSELEYAIGILYDDDNCTYWEYGLYNDIENQKNIEDVYTQIFQTISQNTIQKHK